MIDRMAQSISFWSLSDWSVDNSFGWLIEKIDRIEACSDVEIKLEQLQCCTYNKINIQSDTPHFNKSRIC